MTTTTSTTRPFPVRLGEGIDPDLTPYVREAFERVPDTDIPTHVRIITDHSPTNPRPIRARALLRRGGNATVVAATAQEAVDALVAMVLAG